MLGTKQELNKHECGATSYSVADSLATQRSHKGAEEKKRKMFLLFGVPRPARPTYRRSKYLPVPARPICGNENVYNLSKFKTEP